MPAISLHHIRFTTGSITHIDTKGRWAPPVNQAGMPAMLLHNMSFTTRSIAHKYTKGRWPSRYHSEAKAGNGIQLYILCTFIYLLSL